MIPNNISKEHILKAIKWIDTKGVPTKRESNKFSLVLEGKWYPPKYVITIANLFANGKELSPSLFSGGDETNGYLDKQGFTITNDESNKNEFPITSSSWTILSSTVFIKEMDKSSFIHHGLAIPKVFRHYFNIDSLKRGEHKTIVLIHKGIMYDARFEMDNIDSPRTRLFWKSDLVGLIRSELPDWFSYYKDNTAKPQNLPQLRFERNIERDNVISIEFVNPTEISLDIDGEIGEEQEPKAEGSLKYYYGKRYERKPENRKRAIELHGYVCAVCGFNFEEVYGIRGKRFIEIHHTKPLSTLNKEQIIDPLTDLIPVCSNCHRMIHRRKDDILSIEEIKRTFDEYKLDL